MDLMGYSSNGTLEYGISRSSIIRALSLGADFPSSVINQSEMGWSLVTTWELVIRDDRHYAWECSVE